ELIDLALAVSSVDYDEIRSYVERLVGDGSKGLARVHNESAAMKKYGVFPIDAPTGRFLELITRIRSPKSILEIGPGIGYGSLWLLRGANSKTTLDVIEVNPYIARRFEKIMAREGCRNTIKIHHGAALPVLAKMKRTFDCIFIDADKGEYPDYLRQSLRLTRRGSVILADDIYKFWNNFPAGQKQADQQGVRGYTEMIFKDKRLSSLILPLGDGLAITFRIK
ncbi:MAG TPA: O-methyltransferase, partial [Candidatus Acidoferrum sp.]|nr:O-methyltransferase [Candidatus Acidoferrum sp.]